MDGDHVPSQRVCHWAAWALACVALAIISSACAGPTAVIDSPPRLIAHAGGIGHHRTYTNSLEALDNSVARGYTAVEIDLSWTSDDHLVLLHDWDHEFVELFDRSPDRLTVAEFLSMPSPHGLTRLSLDDLEDWLVDHPNILIVTDIKERNTEGLRVIAEKYGEHLYRILPQIYRPESYREVRELGYDEVIFTLYRSDLSDRQVVDFAIANPLFGVTMPLQSAMEGALSAELAAKGVRVFVNTVNDYSTAARLRSSGVYGVYTDWLSPADEEFSHPLAEWPVLTDGSLPLACLVVPFFPWGIQGLNTVVSFRNTGGSPETVHLSILDSGGASRSTAEFEIAGGDETQVDLTTYAPDEGGQGWILIEAADEIMFRPRWRYLESSDGVWTAARVAATRFETGGSGSGLGGLLVAVVNPTDSMQSYRLRRLIGADEVDDDVADVKPRHQLLRMYRSRTEEGIRLTVSGGPMVTQVLRWDPLDRYMR